ncbi:MAG TPA: FAD-dependent oxidoreductase [Thermodesulfobacteriota bacterium]|nr:FAD-dependent oxidoreductase [Thermodesulfobacteriota bacterium]
MDFRESHVKADVLIIGGGSAGAMAAIRAKEADPGQKVVVFEKGHILYSGCIARGMDALNIVAVPGMTTPGLYVESNGMACEGVMDEPVNYRMAERSYEMMKTVESWGVFFPRDKDGNYELLQVHPKGKFCLTMKEPELKTILAKRLMSLGCKVYNRVMGIELIVQGGRVAGAVGINVQTGELVVCHAPSVILSSGGTARFGLPNSGYLYGVYDFPGNTGDGYAMAFRAGAEVTGFEYTLNYYIIKDINVPLLYITLTRGAHLLTAMDLHLEDNHPSIKSMILEHRKDQGPLRIRMKHLPESKIREIEDILFSTERPVQERFHAGRGINFRSQDIELWPTEYYLCGGHGMTGIYVNEKAASTVPGLYAAGDVSLVARGHLSGAFVYGQIAAEEATAWAKKAPAESFDPAAVDRLKKSLQSRLEQRDGEVSVEEFEYKVRRLIGDYVTPPKNEYKLNMALWWMDRFDQELREKVRIRHIRDLFHALEVENIILCARLSATASLERKESRWGFWHYRADYPKKDDSRWLKHIMLKSGGGREIAVSERPVAKMN